MLAKRIAALLPVLALLWLVPAAAAEGGRTSPDAEGEPLPYADRFDGKDWDAVMEEFLTQHGANTARLGLAYYNTVTGEEHEINGDVYRYAASVYKLPLNMLYAERVCKGEIQMDDVIGGWTYAEAQRLSLENSSNEISAMLSSHLGTRQQYCEALAPLLADDPDTLGEEYLFKCYVNQLTPTQILHALKLLYADPDRYPNVLDHMLKAQQREYFCMTERRYPIAHKYGCLFGEDGATTVNDCGIVYTDDPILLVMFTGNLPGAFTLMADYCTLMCDYTQYTRAVRLRDEAAAAQAAEEAEQARLEAEAKAVEAAREAEAERARLDAEARAAEARAAEGERARLEAANAPLKPDAAGRRFLIAAGAAAALSLIAAPIFWRRSNQSDPSEKCK